MMQPDQLDVAVRGGRLRCARWGPASGAPVVVAAHGITSSWVFWSLVGEAAAGSGLTLVAPDLRGRGDSAGLPGPYGMTSHAADLVTVLDHLGVGKAVVAGHSMGGSVAAVTGVQHPDRVNGILLLDGGPVLTNYVPAGTGIDGVLYATIGPSMERLARRFASREDYRAFWRAHPAFSAVPGELVDAYADHDLTGEAPQLRSKVSAEAVRADVEDILLGGRAGTAVEVLVGPVAFLAAERGVLDQPEGMYPPDRVAQLRARLPRIDVRLVPDTNHFTIGMSRHGAAAVNAALLALARTTST